MFYLPNQQRFDPLNPNSILLIRIICPRAFRFHSSFTLPVAKNFQYGYAQQANLTVEHSLAAPGTQRRLSVDSWNAP